MEAKPAHIMRANHYRDHAELVAALQAIYARYRIPPGTTIYAAMPYFACYGDWQQFASEVLAAYRQYQPATRQLLDHR
jgi:hypothetical protein